MSNKRIRIIGRTLSDDEFDALSYIRSHPHSRCRKLYKKFGSAIDTLEWYGWIQWEYSTLSNSGKPVSASISRKGISEYNRYVRSRKNQRHQEIKQWIHDFITAFLKGVCGFIF